MGMAEKFSVLCLEQRIILRLLTFLFPHQLSYESLLSEETGQSNVKPPFLSYEYRLTTTMLVPDPCRCYLKLDFIKTNKSLRGGHLRVLRIERYR
jgi:hypothetical protein